MSSPRCLTLGCRSDAIPGKGRCRACLNAYARRTRRRHWELTPEQKRRANARSYANVYQRRGRLVPQPCEVCGDVDVQKHHDDYGRPLDVRWFCREHHEAHHRFGEEYRRETDHG